VKVAEQTLMIAIELLTKRKWWSQIASEMQKYVETSASAW